jgi:predicted dehydrogenase
MMIRTAVIGCGKIADSHAEQLHRIKDVQIVAACDREELMARQFCDRYNVGSWFTDAAELIRKTRPTVVHITTPPHSHHDLARLCLESGCHVYVEKPFTLDTAEARSLIAIADANGRKLTVGHDAQFSHASRRMRELVNHGYLGGPPVHIESYYGYGFGSDAYASALLGDRNHWVRKLPGKLLQNVISHGIASIAEFLSGERPEIAVIGFTSPFLARLGASDLVDELRVAMKDETGTTAYFTFSSQMRPGLHQCRIYGPANGIVVDDDKQTVIKLRGASYKSYAEKFIPSVSLAAQYLNNAAFNAKTFVRRDFHMKSGMKALIEKFYDSIATGSPLPIPYREILLTARIMDDIFTHLNAPAELRTT